MGRFVKGDVVVLPFPFSNLKSTKRRPALVLAEVGKQDVVLCQITTKLKSDADAILISSRDFAKGKLKQDSYVRPNRLSTAEESIVLYRAGTPKAAKSDEVIGKIIEILQR